MADSRQRPERRTTAERFVQPVALIRRNGLIRLAHDDEHFATHSRRSAQRAHVCDVEAGLLLDDTERVAVHGLSYEEWSAAVGHFFHACKRIDGDDPVDRGVL